MASILSLGLGLLGAGLAGRVAYQFVRAGKGGAEGFIKGGFKGKMDKIEAMQILGLRK
jgi:DnaJ family protein C protein 19